MKLVELIFTADDRVVSTRKLGASCLDCWNKVRLDCIAVGVRKPQLLRSKIIKEWPMDNFPKSTAHEDECAVLLSKIKYDKNGLEII